LRLPFGLLLRVDDPYLSAVLLQSRLRTSLCRLVVARREDDVLLWVCICGAGMTALALTATLDLGVSTKGNATAESTPTA
jgi:hypothetical protein